MKHYAIYAVFRKFKSTRVPASITEFRYPRNLSNAVRRRNRKFMKIKAQLLALFLPFEYLVSREI
jgi:hypothetical protein